MRIAAMHGLHGARMAFAPEEGGGGGSPPPPPGAPPPLAGGDDWSTGLDDGAKALIATRGWQGKPVAEVLPQVFKSYGELEGLVGTSVKIPGADAKPEDWAAFNTKLGVPEKPEAYKVPPPAGGGQYTEADTAFQQAILPALHGAGLTQRQVDALVPAWNQLQAAQAEAQNTNAVRLADTSKADLTKEWGGEEGYKTNIGYANAAFRQIFGADVPAATQLRLADGTFLGDSPVWAKAFAKLGAQMSEDGVLPIGDGDTAAGGGGGPAAELKAIYAEAAADAKHPYNDAKHPQHSAMVDKVMRLSTQLAGVGR